MISIPPKRTLIQNSNSISLINHLDLTWYQFLPDDHVLLKEDVLAAVPPRFVLVPHVVEPVHADLPQS